MHDNFAGKGKTICRLWQLKKNWSYMAGEKGGKPEQGSSLQLAFHGRLDDFEVFGQSERKISFEVPRPAHHFRQQAVRK